MDTITHGIAGALIGKALFKGEDMFALKPMNRARVVTGCLMLGAIFPDIDVLRDLFSHNQLLLITWHRSITHSLVCMPVWALLLAALTRWIVRWRKWESPSFLVLAGFYAVGILSHILLDLATTFGTMIWSPISWARPAWDVLFIVDFTFTGILLLPQFLAWIHLDAARAKRRALFIWLIFMPAPFIVAAIARTVGAAIADSSVLIAVLVLTLLILLPAYRGWGPRFGYFDWNRAGLAAACIYVGLAVFAHHAAFGRIQSFSALENINVNSIAALPLPPSLWHWDGLILTPRGVYEMRMDLSEKSSLSTRAEAAANPAAEAPIEYHFYPDAPDNSYIEAARRLPQVRDVLWFDRFPVTRFHKEGNEAVVEILDYRFAQLRPGRSPSFTYRVRFDSSGQVLSQGWVRR
ncbi:MAG TPA: metal-dependent hydrolase [Candidatus Acidoferrum sp.]|nr:metal-dependent hydrolase [Candidatus Acidoferrum sp.]